MESDVRGSASLRRFTSSVQHLRENLASLHLTLSIDWLYKLNRIATRD